MRSGRPALWWPLAVVLTALVPATLLLVHDPRYFFHGDTQAAYLGWQYRLGQQLRDGNWPLLDPQAWQAGNMVAEGQAGLFSPLVMAIALLSTVSANVLVFATVTKLVLLCVGATGVHALARSYGAAPPLAYLAAVAAPLGGMSQYLDLASWVAGLMIWALLPWTWWALRRMMLTGAGPFPALALGYLLVTVGYVYGTIMLIVVLGACLLDCAVLRDRTSALRVLGVAGVCGLVALTVYLPGVATAPVTIRGSAKLEMSGKFDSDPWTLLASIIPTASSPGTTLHVLPYAYAAWFLPVLLWVDVGRLRRAWHPLAGLGMVALVTLLVVVGPARLGPLRWPLRLQPFLVMALVVLCAVVLSRYAVRRPSPRRLLLGLLWVAVAGVIAVASFPDGWRGHAVTGAIVAVGLIGLWLLARTGGPGRLLPTGAVCAAALSVGLALVQHAYYPEPPSPERNLPARAADYREPLSEARGDVMVVGNVDLLVQKDRTAVRDFLDGSAWYLNPHPVQNTYTTIGFKRFRDRFPYEYEGSTHPEVLDTLFTREPTTGLLRVDLLAVSTLLMVRADFPSGRLDVPPSGWRVAETTEHAVTWVRRRPVPGAGRPVWTSSGTSVSLVSADHRTARFKVDDVPSGGGRVVLSALAWPGYRTDTGTLTAPVDGYLVTLRLPAGTAGETVTVRYDPPGWPVEVAAWWLGVLAAVVWSLTEAARSRASRPARRRALPAASAAVRTTAR